MFLKMCSHHLFFRNLVGLLHLRISNFVFLNYLHYPKLNQSIIDTFNSNFMIVHCQNGSNPNLELHLSLKVNGTQSYFLFTHRKHI